jgi:hypothetical protein
VEDLGSVYLFFPWPLKLWAIEAALCFGGAPSEYKARGLEALHYDYTAALQVVLGRASDALEAHRELSEEKQDPDFITEQKRRIRITRRKLEIYGG